MGNRIEDGISSRSAGKPPSEARAKRARTQQGQAMVEFAFTAVVAMIVLIVSVQFAIVGNAALAVNQVAYAGARYAAVNPNSSPDAITSYIKSIASPMIGENGGAHITVTVTPSTTPRTFGNTVQVVVSYDLTSKLFLPNPCLGITFPTTISNVQSTMMSE